MLEFARKALVCSEQSSAQAGKGDGTARVGDGEERREERAAGIAGEIKKQQNRKTVFFLWCKIFQFLS